MGHGREKIGAILPAGFYCPGKWTTMSGNPTPDDTLFGQILALERQANVAERDGELQRAEKLFADALALFQQLLSTRFEDPAYVFLKPTYSALGGRLTWALDRVWSKLDATGKGGKPENK